MIWFFFPEIKRLSLEELDFYFAKTYGHGNELKQMEMEAGKKGDVTKIEVADQ